MRIAYVCADPGVPVFGRKGCSIHVQEVVRAFRKCGARVELFATRLGGEPPADLRGMATHQLPAVAGDDLASRERAALDANGAVRQTLDREGPFDLVYERYSLWSYAGMEAARDAGAPGLLEVNAPLIDEQAMYRGLADRAAAERVAQQAFAAADALIAVSRGVADYLGQFPMDPAKVQVVGNGVNLDRFPADLRPSCPAPAGTLTVGFVGTLKPWHGLPDMVEAFDRLYRRGQNVRLLIVGDGPERASLETDLAARGLTAAARLTGAVDPAAIPGLLASMHVAVAPYPDRPDFYFSPLKLFEYMAAGRAVVASRIGQVADVIDPGVNGLLHTPGDPAALAEDLELLRGAPGLRWSLGRAARAAARRRHSWDAVARRLLRLAGRPAEVRV